MSVRALIGCQILLSTSHYDAHGILNAASSTYCTGQADCFDPDIISKYGWNMKSFDCTLLATIRDITWDVNKSHSVRCYTKLQFLLNIVQESLEILYKARVVEIDCDIFSQ